MQTSAMSSEAAHSVSNITVNFTNTEATVSGAKVEFFREIFDMQMAGLPTIHQGHVLQIDPARMNHNAGFQIAGMLGLDVLHTMTVHLDYRDGLVKLEPVLQDSVQGHKSKTGNEPEQAACPVVDTLDHPISTTIEASVTGTLESGHLKPGKEIWVKTVTGWNLPECSMDVGANIYGHVISSTSTKDSGSSELSLTFDHADCAGQGKKAISMQLIGLVGPHDQTRNIADELPAEVAGGARQMTDVVNATYGVNMNPGGRPNTIHAGIVIRMPNVKLEPFAGQGCSAKITSTNHSIQLGTGTELVLLMRGTPKQP
jgi:hypothetical protein